MIKMEEGLVVTVSAEDWVYIHAFQLTDYFAACFESGYYTRDYSKGDEPI